MWCSYVCTCAWSYYIYVYILIENTVSDSNTEPASAVNVAKVHVRTFCACDYAS